jgi:choline dehydrogenase
MLAFVKTDSALAYPDVQFHFPKMIYEDHGRTVIQKEGFSITANGTRPKSRGQ